MMYRMRKIVSHDGGISLPTCMYRLKNVNDSTNELLYNCEVKIKEQVIKFLKKSASPSSKMTELERRQDQLLEHLDILLERIKSLTSLCKTETVNVALHATNKKPQIVSPGDIILNTSAEYLPYFLVVLAKGALKEKITLNYHIHSSVSSRSVDKIKQFVKMLNIDHLTGPAQVRLIFKEVSANTELKCSATSVPIIGEVNILRYLALVFPEVIPYDETVEEDSLLDECYLLQRSKSSDNSLQNIFAGYKGDWILGCFSIVDIAAISVIKQIEAKTPKLFKFTPKPWFEKAGQLLK